MAEVASKDVGVLQMQGRSGMRGTGTKDTAEELDLPVDG